jgi:methylenetetrahydrofolate reductase (NADPH)
VPHLTCASAPKSAVRGIAANYLACGFRHIVALRGDRPKEAPQDGAERYRFAAELVATLGRIGGFEISVAAYPEVHPEAPSAAADLDNLKRKIDAGASRAITQYCFDTETVLRFRDRMGAAGITVPLAVGILPVHDFGQVRRFSERCGAGVPAWLGALFEGLEDEPAQQNLVGACVAAEQARRLTVEGIPQRHFYTVNRAEPTLAACRLLGLRAAPARAAAA